MKRFVYFPQPKKLENKVDFSNTDDLDMSDFYFDFHKEKSNEGRNYFSD